MLHNFYTIFVYRFYPCDCDKEKIKIGFEFNLIYQGKKESRIIYIRKYKGNCVAPIKLRRVCQSAISIPFDSALPSLHFNYFNFYFISFCSVLYHVPNFIIPFHHTVSLNLLCFALSYYTSLVLFHLVWFVFITFLFISHYKHAHLFSVTWQFTNILRRFKSDHLIGTLIYTIEKKNRWNKIKWRKKISKKNI